MTETSKLRKIAGYGCTGGLAAVVDVFGFWLLFQWGVPLVGAAVTAFLIASVCNYALSARFVFGRPISVAGYGKFLAAALLGAGINLGLTVALIAVFGVDPLASKVVATGVAFVANFVLNDKLVFGKARA